MIEKLLRLRNTGVFSDALPNGAVALGQCTIIYGENGRGKTTLSHLLRSLCTGDCGCLKPRTTIGSGASPAAEVLISGSHHLLKGYNWTPPRAQISIFDTEFVNRNVYSGSGVTPEHRSNLCKFVLGEEGVQLALAVDRLNDEVKQATTAITTAETGVKSLVGTDMTVEQFVDLREDPGIDSRIEEAQKLVDAAADAEAVLKHSGLVQIQMPPAPSGDDMGVLVETIEDLSAHAVGMVRRHISEHLDDNGEVWLKTGLGYLSGDRCPFCGQDTGGLDLLDAFRGYFDEAYEALVAKVTTQSQAIRTSYSEAGLNGLRATASENSVAREYWSKYTTVSPLSLVWDEVETLWERVGELLLPLFDRKLTDPSEAVAFAEPLRKVAMCHASAMAVLTTYNKQVDEINATVKKCKLKLSSTGADTHAAALRSLRLQKRRWEDDVVVQCEALRQRTKQKGEKTAAKDVAKGLLDKHVREFATDYRQAVNDFLTKCNASFQIEGIKATFTGGDARSDFSIGLFGHTVNASTKAGDDPHFDTALSDGDKRTLAFAFFLARLQRDANLGSKIVVLDDPVASLDAHRRRCTIEAIVDLATGCGQLIIMTHDPHFAVDMTNTLTQAGMTKGGGLVTLGLQRSGKWSIISPCDPSDICQVAYEASVEDLHAFAADSCSVPALDAVRSIRPAIEGLLRIKYPLELKGKRQVGQMITAIEACEADSRLAGLKGQVKELYAVTNYASEYMHVDDPHTQSVPRDAEAVGYVGRALVLMDLL